MSSSNLFSPKKSLHDNFLTTSSTNAYYYVYARIAKNPQRKQKIVQPNLQQLLRISISRFYKSFAFQT